ncbi:MAG TPA: LytS/YhcK type 5TM receptor domain-containing protein, partial [Candidatus Eisenbacteria bacterium]|nr:LytS/YhcK type 5TM receptor domain-containing protein [Candidatus Eisenbacteria bacterium]
IETREGVFVDGRAIPIALIALFEGWGPGLIAGLTAAVYRVYLGGAGAPAGVLVILAVATAGGLAHRWAGGTSGCGSTTRSRSRSARSSSRSAASACWATRAGRCSRASGRPICC